MIAVLIMSVEVLYPRLPRMPVGRQLVAIVNQMETVRELV